MTFTLKIDCDNTVFGDNPADEIARILGRASTNIEGTTLGHGDKENLRDFNGNTVGQWSVKGKRS